MVLRAASAADGGSGGITVVGSAAAVLGGGGGTSAFSYRVAYTIIVGLGLAVVVQRRTDTIDVDGRHKYTVHIHKHSAITVEQVQQSSCLFSLATRDPTVCNSGAHSHPLCQHHTLLSLHTTVFDLYYWFEHTEYCIRSVSVIFACATGVSIHIAHTYKYATIEY